MVPSLQDPETRTGLVSKGSLQLKPGTGSCIQSGQKYRGLTAGEVRNWQFPGRAWDVERSKIWVEWSLGKMGRGKL